MSPDDKPRAPSIHAQEHMEGEINRDEPREIRPFPPDKALAWFRGLIPELAIDPQAWTREIQIGKGTPSIKTQILAAVLAEVARQDAGDYSGAVSKDVAFAATYIRREAMRLRKEGA